MRTTSPEPIGDKLFDGLGDLPMPHRGLHDHPGNISIQIRKPGHLHSERESLNVHDSGTSSLLSHSSRAHPQADSLVGVSIYCCPYEMSFELHAGALSSRIGGTMDEALCERKRSRNTSTVKGRCLFYSTPQ